MTTVESTKNQCNIGSCINVTVADFILTPASCAFLVNEVMKNLLYQRSQIPYPYAWLKNVVSKKRRSLEESEEDTQKNFTLSRHYRIVSGAYDSAEKVMSDIVKAFTHYGSKVKEVIFLIGVTPVCPKEVFTIRVTSLAHGHSDRNHVLENSKKQGRILRSIFLENSWMGLIENSISCNNTFIFLKVDGSQDNVITCDDGVFIPSKPVCLLPKVKHTVINLNYLETDVFSCCDKLEIFKDSNDIDLNSRTLSSVNVDQELVSSSKEVWLQSKISIQGFKDCFINKVSACELW